MRCFVALELPDAPRRALAGMIDALRRTNVAVRWTAPDKLHVTLKFLGEIDAAAVETMAAEVRAVGAADGALAFALRLAGLGTSRHPQRLLWAWFRGDDEAVASLAGRFERAAAALGVPPEERPFWPHVTLGRPKANQDRRPLEAAVNALAASDTFPGEPFAPSALVLFRSTLTPSGSVYETLARVTAPDRGGRP